MGVGGLARYFLEAPDEASVLAACRWAAARDLPLHVLGAGSNVVVADEGVDGLVVWLTLRGISMTRVRGSLEVTAAAGEVWDKLVARTVEAEGAGLECLSGIPGLVGATPIQNVGAYGQEVSQTVTAVRAFDRAGDRVVVLEPDECGFTYRDSRFKSGEPGRHVVLAVTYRLRLKGKPTVNYADLERALAAQGFRKPGLAEVRRCVLDIRRAKSMVLDAADPNRRSCGSFFLNPIVDAAAFVGIERAVANPGMPRWYERDGRVKLSAAWLIERAGFTRGTSRGAVGLSTRHSLAIVCHEGARAADIVAFAREIRRRVEERFRVRLVPEPVLWGGLSLGP
jgi:UDP-N-acetylmuramate dehydrogenase